MDFDSELRVLLRHGDALAKAGEYAGAAQVYASAARLFAAGGHTLKAVAVLRQVRQLVREHAPQEHALDDEARDALPALYRALGLNEDALAVERESRNSK